MANQITYGFFDLESVFDMRVSQVGVDIVMRAVDVTLAEHNRQMNALLGLLADRTTDAKRSYNQAGLRRLQPADEFSRALPRRSFGTYDIAFPIQSGQDALGFTYEASKKITVQEVNDQVNAMMIGDARWMRDHALAALLDNTTWSYRDPYYGSLTIQPLANGDAVTYGIFNGADSGAVDTHHLAQAAAVADATNPVDDDKTELMEHPENGGKAVLIAGTTVANSIKGLATFNEVSDPNIRPGSAASVLVGDLGVDHPGELIGYESSGVWIVQWDFMPANYYFMVATEGARPLAMREHPEPELQGFRRDADRNDYPWYEQQWTRRAGFGAQNRVGAVVRFVSAGDTTYDIPTGYSAPMP